MALGLDVEGPEYGTKQLYPFQVGWASQGQLLPSSRHSLTVMTFSPLGDLPHTPLAKGPAGARYWKLVELVAENSFWDPCWQGPISILPNDLKGVLAPCQRDSDTPRPGRKCS